jgi:hypothetical protein
MKKAISILALIVFPIIINAQYAPQAGISGSTALHKNSTQIVNWATQCTLQKGWMDIANPSLGSVTSGDSSYAIGSADNLVVSLGDSGVAVLNFASPVVNGVGADFAVFENGFLNTANNEEAFLELAFVEVSSDGINFFRFPATSNTQTTQQITGTGAPGTGDYINARDINNLAGKYISNYGTPFDLEELKNTVGLNVNHITHIRLVDVVGAVNAHAQKDNNDHIINEPYPTPFPTSGFDLDAVAVLHQLTPSSVTNFDVDALKLVPNPVSDFLQVVLKNKEDVTIQVKGATGKILIQTSTPTIDVSILAKGIYFITINNKDGKQCTEKFIKI